MGTSDSKKQKSKNSKTGSKEGTRVGIINSIKTPLGFFSLVVLVVEAILGTTTAVINGMDRTILILGMIAIIFLLVISVTILALYGPKALLGKAYVTGAQERLSLEDAESYVNFGNDFLDRREWDKAKEYFERALKVNPKYPDAWYNLGRMYYDMRDYRKAIEKQKKAVEIDPQNADAWEILGLAFCCLGKHEEAVANLEKASNLNPREPRVWYNLGWAYSQKGNYKRAIEKYKKALEIDQYYKGAWEELGYACEKMGNQEEAQRCYNKARQLVNPSYAPP